MIQYQLKPKREICRLIYSPDSKWLFITCYQCVWILDVANAMLSMSNFPNGRPWVFGCFHPNSKIIVCFLHNRLCIIEKNNRGWQQKQSTPSNVNLSGLSAYIKARYSPNGQEFWLTNRQLYRWDAHTFAELPPLYPHNGQPCFHRLMQIGTGGQVAALHHFNGSAPTDSAAEPVQPYGELVRLDTGGFRRLFAHERLCVASTSCFNSSDTVYACPNGYGVDIWDINTGNYIHRRTGRTSIQTLAFTPDDNRLLVTSTNFIRVYAYPTWDEVKCYDFGLDGIRAIAVAPDGNTAAVGTRTGCLAIFDLD
jgi:WD40 repeat protein